MTVPFVHSRVIKWGDTDAATIAYTVRFFDFCMEAIEDWFRNVCDTDWFILNINHHVGTPFVNINMDLMAPLTPRHQLNTEVYIAKLGKASLSFCLKGMRNDNVQSFEARFTCCFVDNQKMVSKPIPDDIREKIVAYIESGGGLSDK